MSHKLWCSGFVQVRQVPSLLSSLWPQEIYLFKRTNRKWPENAPKATISPPGWINPAPTPRKHGGRILPLWETLVQRTKKETCNGGALGGPRQEMRLELPGTSRAYSTQEKAGLVLCRKHDSSGIWLRRRGKRKIQAPPLDALSFPPST